MGGGVVLMGCGVSAGELVMILLVWWYCDAAAVSSISS
jgi:hypothetical protein